MMTPEIAQAAIQFMMRVQLTGQEVPAFNAVMQAMHELAESEAGIDGNRATDTA